MLAVRASVRTRSKSMNRPRLGLGPRCRKSPEGDEVAQSVYARNAVLPFGPGRPTQEVRRTGLGDERGAIPPVPGLPPQPEHASGCLGGQAFRGCHGVWSRTMALRVVRSFRMTATRATFFGRPREVIRS